MQLNNKVTKEQAIAQLWRRGKLSWLLDANQKQLYDIFYNSPHLIQTWLCSRRLGKSYALCVLALETCLRNPNNIVKFLSPTKNQIKMNIRPLFRQILESCPDDIKPELKEKDDIYYFNNGSEIQLAGTDAGNAERLRGGNSNICIVDEAGSCDNLKYIIKSILLPTTLMTKGKVLMASTPAVEFDHDFHTFVEDAQLKGILVKKTIYDNPRLDPEMLKIITDETGGVDTEDFRREYLCEIIKSINSSVIPEFTDDLKKQIVMDWPKPSYFHAYEGMDVGFKDFTGVLFGYYDFKNAKIIIEDEIAIRGNELKLPNLARDIMSKEEQHFRLRSTGEMVKIDRVSDIDYIVMNELYNHSNGVIKFRNADKTEKGAAINNLRVLLNSKQIIINPRCKTLISHLENVKWSKANTKIDFARDTENGHYDLVDALLYLTRAISFQKNPYPSDFKSDDHVFINHSTYTFNGFDNQIDKFKKIFKVKK